MLMVVWGDRVKKQKQTEKQAWTQLLWLPAALLEPSEPSHSCRRRGSMTAVSGEEKNAEASSANSGTFLPHSRLTQQN